MFKAAVAAVILFTVVRIATTYQVFSQTADEPVHIGAGQAYLISHARSYGFDPEHPPLARALFGLPFIHIKAKTQVRPSQIAYYMDRTEYGNDLLETEDRYIHNLTKARRGNLVFVAIALLSVALIARKLLGDMAGFLACVLLASLPPFLAHGGLATTDIAGTASFALALYALLEWCDAPTWPGTLLFGLALGFGVLCKYSFLPFFGVAAIITLIVHKGPLRIGKMLAALLIGFAVVWLGFGLTVDTMRHVDPDTAEFAKIVLKNEHIADIRLPAPPLFAGLLQVANHDRVGHPNFLLGKESPTKGWWYYFPIVVAVKTPIGLLLLYAIGVWTLARARPGLEHVLIPIAILGIGMLSTINIGVRHMLPIYVPMAVVAVAGVLRYRVIGAVLAAWIVIGSLVAHPDYIPWMNAFAGQHPETVLEDSNFDWGQDVWRLVRLLQKRHIERIGYDVFTSVRPSSVHYTNGFLLDPQKKSSGWIVISEQKLQPAIAHDPTAYQWLKPYPFERVGKTIRLYHIP